MRCRCGSKSLSCWRSQSCPGDGNQSQTNPCQAPAQGQRNRSCHQTYYFKSGENTDHQVVTRTWELAGHHPVQSSTYLPVVLHPGQRRALRCLRGCEVPGPEDTLLQKTRSSVTVCSSAQGHWQVNVSDCSQDEEEFPLAKLPGRGQFRNVILKKFKDRDMNTSHILNLIFLKGLNLERLALSMSPGC